jgi:hypothetical protein
MCGDLLDLYNGFRITIVTANVGPEGNSDGLLGTSKTPGKGNPLKVSIGPTSRVEFDVG